MDEKPRFGVVICPLPRTLTFLVVVSGSLLALAVLTGRRAPHAVTPACTGHHIAQVMVCSDANVVARLGPRPPRPPPNPPSRQRNREHVLELAQDVPDASRLVARSLYTSVTEPVVA